MDIYAVAAGNLVCAANGTFEPHKIRLSEDGIKNSTFPIGDGNKIFHVVP